MENQDQFFSPRNLRKVPSACQRCRRQKLKCDIDRPCTLCARAGVECLPASTSQWRVYHHSQTSETAPPAKRSRRAVSPPADRENTTRPVLIGSDTTVRTRNEHPSNTNQQVWRSSSTMSLVEGVFQIHNTAAPCDPERDAIPGGETQDGTCDDVGQIHDDDLDLAPCATQSNRSASYQKQLSFTNELLSLIPPYKAADLLVDTYFDRVHWFMLIFHQDDFRQKWPNLYRAETGTRAVNGTHDPGFLSIFLMVIAIGAQYVGPHRRRLLAGYKVDPEELKERIFSTIKARLLDIIAVNSLEAVQTCVLLGTYYLFHGAPRLAWPVCGCGLRVAQSLNLHRRLPRNGLTSSTDSFLNKQNETRKRCWWAIYEIETFCSMSYGYPHSIKDLDCDVEPLNPSAKLQIGQSPQSFEEPLRCETTLLSYKYYMSKLSVLTKAVLTELYGIGSAPLNNEGRPAESASSLRKVIQKVAQLDARLREWQDELPSKLQWQLVISTGVAYSSTDEFDRDIGASGSRFDNHIYHLQALALKLAYENTMILVHRPLLSYRLVARGDDGLENLHGSGANQVNPFRKSLQSCREAALSMSEIINSPILDLVSETYAAAFVSIHTFTAGVTLGILSSIEPLTLQAQEAKVGLHRLMAIQAKLKPRSVLATQGLDILQRLTKLVIEKELNCMLDVAKMPQQHGSSGVGPSVAQPMHRTRLSTCNQPASGLSVRDQPEVSETERTGDVLFLAGTSGTNSLEDRHGLPYVEDTTLLETLYDFDQAFSTYSNGSWLDPDPSSGASTQTRALYDEGFPILEQTWIWGLDNLPSHS